MTTLAQLEQEVARRLGPFQIQITDLTTPATSTVGYAVVPALQSLLGINTIDNLFLLRRAAGVTTDDRQRMVVDLDPTSGRVQVDRTWQTPPSPGEELEFHHLDPAQELRPVVMAGLRRCLVQERVLLGPGYIYEADLSIPLPWLQNANQIQRVQTGPYPSGWPGWWGGPTEVPFDTFMECGHVWLRVSGGIAWGPFYGGLLITLIRPADTLGAGPDGCSAAPMDDEDSIAISMDYAAAAGHIEAWHRLPARLQAASADGWQASQKDAAAEFTRQAYINEPPNFDRYAHRRSTLWSLSGRAGGSYTGGRTVVNS